ncbi:hypothetical protein [Piscinibacter sp.]|jgi:hypothetical protein|uniref:hypothetical protein n=1 Tax=Piscinibacter sp. TaxID=1903157 RepID=UPI00355A616F
MSERASFSVLPLAGLILAAALSGCVIAPAQPYYPVDGPVMVAPPAPREEYIGVAPVVGQIWLSGYWGWSGGRHVWIGGHWDAPRPGHRWVPHQWVHERDGWRLHHGHWDKR